MAPPGAEPRQWPAPRRVPRGLTRPGQGRAAVPSSAARLRHLKLVFERHGCTAQTCHGEKAEGGLDLRSGTAYRNLVDAPAKGSAMARVQPGTAQESYLYLKLTRAATVPGTAEYRGQPHAGGPSPAHRA